MITSYARARALEAVRIITPDRRLSAIARKAALLNAWLSDRSDANAMGTGILLVKAAEDARLAEEQDVDALIERAETYFRLVGES